MSRLEGLIQAIWWTNAVLAWKTKIWGPKNRNVILETYLSWVKWNILLKWIVDCIKSQNQKLTEGQDWSGMGMEFWAGIMLRPQLPKCHYLRFDFVVISTKASSLLQPSSHHLQLPSFLIKALTSSWSPPRLRRTSMPTRTGALSRPFPSPDSQSVCPWVSTLPSRVRHSKAKLCKIWNFQCP